LATPTPTSPPRPAPTPAVRHVLPTPPTAPTRSSPASDAPNDASTATAASPPPDPATPRAPADQPTTHKSRSHRADSRHRYPVGRPDAPHGPRQRRTGPGTPVGSLPGPSRQPPPTLPRRPE